MRLPTLRLLLAVPLALASTRRTDAAPPAALAPPVRLTNGQLETRPLAGPLAATVRNVAPGPAWIGYTVPALRRGHMCCFDSVPVPRARSCGGCRLEGGRGGVSFEAGGVRLEPSTAPVALILLRVQNGQVGRVGAYSADCALDAGGLRVLWLHGVPPSQSLDLLESLASPDENGAAGRERGQSLAEEALAAVAAHADPAADALLERQTAPGRPGEVREQAAFWMGEARGRRGYETLRRLVREDHDRKFREHVVFALSQSDVPEATDTLVETARTDRDRDVRGQALFWLAQEAGQKAKAAISRAIENDPDLEVKKKAVFALSEMDDGVPMLIQLARSNPNPAVREQAFFWLGESEDPKALDFLAEVLARR